MEKLSPEQMKMLLKELATRKAMKDGNPANSRQAIGSVTEKLRAAASSQPDDLVAAKRSLENMKPRPQLSVLKGGKEAASSVNDELEKFLSQQGPGGGFQVEPKFNPTQAIEPTKVMGSSNISGKAKMFDDNLDDIASALGDGADEVVEGTAKTVKKALPMAKTAGKMGLKGLLGAAGLLMQDDLNAKEGDEAIAEDPDMSQDIRMQALKRLREQNRMK